MVYRALPNVTLAAVADIRPEMAAERAGNTNTRTYVSLEDMLGAEKLDIVDVCLPTYLHAEYAVKAWRPE